MTVTEARIDAAGPERRHRAERVCMLLFNPFQHDSRVLKEGTTLDRAGYDVRLVAVAAPSVPRREERDGIRIVRVAGQPRTMAAVDALRRIRARWTAARRGSATSGGAAASVNAAECGRGPAARLRELAGGAYGVMAWTRFARAALRATCAEPAEIVLAHDLNTLPVAALAARRLGARLLYDSHEVFAELPVHSGLARRRWLVVERALLPKVESMWMSSPGHAEVFAANHGVPVPPVIINVPSLDPDPRAAGLPDLHAQLDLDPGLAIALYIGGVYPHRPLRMVVDAVRELEDCAAVIIGPGLPSYMDELRGRADELGIAERVRVASAVPIADVVRYSAAADVGIVPFLNTSLNNFHGLPNKVFEYIAAGTPVVASDFPQIRAVIDRHQVGRTFDPDQPGALTEAIQGVLGDPERLAMWRANAAVAATQLNWEVESRRLLEIVGRARGEVAESAQAVSRSRARRG
jgi:glycosyltransferase involved in cell wall biosynthesis